VIQSGLADEAAAFGVADDVHEDRLVIAVCAKQLGVCGDEALLTRIRAALRNDRLDAQVVWLNALPRTANGKVDLRALRQLLPTKAI